MRTIVATAEANAATTCEISGRDDGVLGQWRGRSWLRTLSLSLYGPQGFEPRQAVAPGDSAEVEVEVVIGDQGS